MRRRLMGLLLPLVALTVLATAIPAAASAASLRDEEGFLLQPGTQVTLNTQWLELVASTGRSSCDFNSMLLSGQVANNSDSTVKAYSTGSGTCTFFSPPVMGTSQLFAINWNLRLNVSEGSEIMPISFVTQGADSTCEWEGTPTVSYSGGTDSFTVSGVMESEQCGQASIDAKFLIEDSRDGSKVLLSHDQAAFKSAGEGTSTVHLSAEELLLGTGLLGEVYCPISSSGSLVEASETLTLGDILGNECGEALAVRGNGCGLTLHAGIYQQFGASSGGAVDIVCPAGKRIEMEVGPDYIGFIPAQEGLRGSSKSSNGGSDFETLGWPGDVKAQIEVENIAYSVEVYGEESIHRDDGWLEIPEGVLSATNAEGAPTGLWMSLYH